MPKWWNDIKDNIRFFITVSAFLYAVFVGTLGIYHKYFLMPAIEGTIIERDKALGHTVLYWTASHFSDSYAVIPNKKPHQAIKLQHFNKQRDFFYSGYKTAYDKGLTIELAPLD